MAIKIYNKGGSVVVEDGTEYIQSVFSYYAEGDNITVIDRISDNFVWNLKFDGFLNESGTAIGSSASAVLDYLGSLTTTEVATIDYNTEVALGKVAGAELWNKFGYNQDIDIGTEVIASWGGTFTPLTTATALTMSSTSADDDDGGTGCNSIVIYGIDENRNSVSQQLIPEKFEVFQNYPNPFNPSTTIKFGLPDADLVNISVYNMLGQKIATLVNREMKAGYHEINFQVNSLSSGMYIYQIRAGKYVESKRMSILK